MTLRHLRIFMTVADCGTMHEAARKLHISQPSVSQAVRELEDYYKIRLFERLSNRLYITETGSQLLDYVRHIMDSFRRMEEFTLDASKQKQVRVGASVSVGTCLLPKIVQKIKALIPDLDLRVTVNNTSTIESMLLDSSLDLALVEGTVLNTDLIQVPIAEDELVLVAAPLHPLFACGEITLSALTSQRLISRETGSAKRNQFEQFLATKGITMKNGWTCSNTETIKKALLMGEDLAILSQMLVEDEVAAGTFKIIKLEDVHITRSIKMIYHPGKFLSPSMRVLMDVCTGLGGQPDTKVNQSSNNPTS